VGGELGSISWRGPFIGVAVLMTIALLATVFVLPATPATGRAAARPRSSRSPTPDP
jgi:predicted MFS family arabinose efflux permease